MNTRLLSFSLWFAAGLPLRAAWAQAPTPSQGGEISLVRVTATTMELRFGTRGTGQGRVVAMAATASGMPVPLVAADGQFYAANAAYGQGAALSTGFVVYSGEGHSAIVTGLRPGTYYYITNAEYNADSTSISYNTRGSSMSTTTATAAVPPAPLPVELKEFRGTVDARGAAVLHWATATERNTAYFALERSVDGASFAEAGRVAAAGASSRLLTYEWPDPARLTQPTYYRLRQADRDGAAHFSDVVLLTPPPPLPRLARQLNVFPNPSAGEPVRLSLQGYENETLTLRIADPLGRLVLAQTLMPMAAQYCAPLPLPAGLAAGTYILTLAGSGRPVQKRLVVAN